MGQLIGRVAPAEIQGFFLALAVLCGKDDDRERCGPHLRTQLFQDAEAVQPGHLQVENDEIDPAPLDGLERVKAVDRLSRRSAWTVLALR